MDEKIENFKQRWVGKGAFGDVFELEGYQPPAVLKLLNSPKKEHRVEFEKECDILKALKHPNIVQFFRWEQIDNKGQKFGIIMEYCQIGNLRQVISDPSVIYTMNTVIQWGEQLFDGLAYMYRERRIAHRDIKPENIFLTSDWTPKIGDFGLTKLIEMTMTGTFTGTYRYMSPRCPDESKEASELIKAGQQHSHKNDVYSLGLTLWELIERKPVFDDYYSHRGFNYENFLFDIFSKTLNELKRPDCDEKISDLVASCTNFNRLMRPEAQEVTARLREIREKDSFIASLDYLPLKGDDQRGLIKPIGFNGKRERIWVKGLRQEMDSSGSSEGSTLLPTSQIEFR